MVLTCCTAQARNCFISPTGADPPARSRPVSTHALSNHLLDTRWPKAAAARARFEAVVQQTNVDPEQIFASLSDPAPFAAGMLPDTGVGPERERILSPIFIDDEKYGTRSTTVLLIDRADRVTFIERTFDRSRATPATERYSFRIEVPSR